MRGVFNPSILNHHARGCRSALLPAWMHAITGGVCDAIPTCKKRYLSRALATQKARG
ncbi:hypothetical protein [Paraburkholderia ultramafica]|uniref:hypothetical protein n=1 Tax=Paraburkholderia ultramafica TaxID=1544867 RepID=UPI001583D626|nr:hypothetical protein [Paraburkholderia ultramafica]